MIDINSKEFRKIDKNDIIKFLEQEDTEENFFIEFKEDDVSPKKLIEEISAFSNTNGGYIFLGISDDKQIMGCTTWNEQRITTTVIECINPIPIYDIKKFEIEDKKIYIIKIFEGNETPYISNRGNIYERIGSSSVKVTKSERLIKLYEKSEKKMQEMQDYLDINKPMQEIGNLYGYLDMGFSLKLKNTKIIQDIIFSDNQDELIEILKRSNNKYSITRVGASIFITLAELSSKDTNVLPADVENFMEIMIDGSVRLRTIFLSDDKLTIKFQNNLSLLLSFADIYYEFVLKKVFKDFISFYRYEKLTILKQFVASLAIGEEEYDNEFYKFYKKNQQKYGEQKIISGVRLPRTGLLRIDKEYFDKNNLEFNLENLRNLLFYSNCIDMGYIEPFEYKKDKTIDK